jgi:HSP20 family molecular chaperone IbpA
MKHAASKKKQNMDPRFVIDNSVDYEIQHVHSEFTNWQPLYNLYTTPDTIMVHLELPGVDMQDVVVHLHSRYMVVAGTRRAPVGLTRDCCVFHNLEIPYGNFSRHIDFPVPIEIHKYDYEVRDGILTFQFQVLTETIIPIEGD